MKIALLQIMPGADLKENEQRGIDACIKASRQGCDIALFPEMFSNGYNVSSDAAVLKRQAISLDGPFIITFQKLAAKLKMAIGITLLEQYQPSPRNTLILFDRCGKKVLTYAKVHTCDFDVEKGLTAGVGFEVADLDTAAGPLCVGAMICYDREFPESARILMLKGAELILVPNACPMEINRLAQLRSRAFENMTAIATCNYPSGQPDCNGNSTVFDGMAWLDDKVRDMCLVQGDEKEGLVIADIDIDRLRRYRQDEVMGNAYRHPEKYHELIETAVKPPFIRPDKRK